MSAEWLDEVKNILETEKGDIKIELDDQGIGDKQVKVLVEMLKRYPTKKIVYLSLYRNDIYPEGAKLLATLQNVQELQLGYNNVGDEGAKVLIASAIEKLDISDNAITDSCAEFIANNAQQTYLCLERNRKMSRQSLVKIAEVVERNKQKSKFLEQGNSSLTKSQEAETLGIFKSPHMSSPKGRGHEKKEVSPTGSSPNEGSPREDDVVQNISESIGLDLTKSTKASK